MKTCKKCGCQFPFLVEINGETKNVGSRTFCLKCSPYGTHNTSKCPDQSPKSIINKLSLDEFKALVKQSTSRTDIFLKLKMRKSGASFSILNKRLVQDNIDISHFITGSTGRDSTRKQSDDVVYRKNSTYKHIRSRVMRDNFMAYQCVKCNNNGEWLNSKLTLALDHINGDRYDNRKENLRWLCPNCHSQTETYCSKNKF